MGFTSTSGSANSVSSPSPITNHKGTYAYGTAYASGDYVQDKYGFQWKANSALSASTHGTNLAFGYVRSYQSESDTGSADLAAISIPISDKELREGDHFIAVLMGMTSATPTIPGWTYYSRPTYVANTAGYVYIFYRTVTASEAAAGISFDAPVGGTQEPFAMIRQYRGVTVPLVSTDTTYGRAAYDASATSSVSSTVYTALALPANPASSYVANAASIEVTFFTADTLTNSNTTTVASAATEPTNIVKGTEPFIQTHVVGFDKVLTSSSWTAQTVSTAATCPQTMFSVVIHGGSTAADYIPDSGMWTQVTQEEVLPDGDPPYHQFRDSYSTSTTYDLLDSVEYTGSIYVAIKAAPASTHDVSGAPNPAFWQKSPVTSRLLSQPVPTAAFIPSPAVPAGLTLHNTYTASASGLTFPREWVYVVAVGGGGGNGNGSTSNAGGGGGGGACIQGWVKGAALTAVTIGAGANAMTSSGGHGNRGGDTIAGPIFAQGGSGGLSGAAVATTLEKVLNGQGQGGCDISVAANQLPTPASTVWGMFSGGESTRTDLTAAVVTSGGGGGQFSGAGYSGGSGTQGPGGGGGAYNNTGTGASGAGGSSASPTGVTYAGGAERNGYAGGGGAGILGAGSSADAGSLGGLGGGGAGGRTTGIATNAGQIGGTGAVLVYY